MKFTILSHAGLLVEHAGVRVVCDPWLIGSCYWRSWWNFPEPDPELIANLRADFVYLTHLHWDHFHGQRMFSVWSASKRLRIKLPASEALAAATRWLTFLDLYELDTFPLAVNFSPRSLAVRLRRWREPVELAALLLRRALLRRRTTLGSLYPLKAT